MEEGSADEGDTDEAGDDLWYLVTDAEEHDRRQCADRPVSTVLEVPVVVERPLADQVDGQRPDVHRPDAETRRDDEDVAADRERADHTVEREGRVQNLEVEEQEERLLADSLHDRVRTTERLLHRLHVSMDAGSDLVELVGPFALEQLTQTVDGQVGDETQDSREQHGTGLFRQGLGHHAERDGRHHDRQLVQLADARERTLEPRQPGDLPVLEQPVQDQHEEEHPTERSDARVRMVQQVRVGARLVDAAAGECLVDRLHRSETSREHDHEQREDQPHAEDGDDDADRQEDLLPPGGHALQHLGVHDGVVKRQRHLEHAQDEDDGQGRRTSEVQRQQQADGGDPEGPLEVTKQVHLDSFRGSVGTRSGLTPPDIEPERCTEDEADEHVAEHQHLELRDHRVHDDHSQQQECCLRTLGHETTSSWLPGRRTTDLLVGDQADGDDDGDDDDANDVAEDELDHQEQEHQRRDGTNDLPGVLLQERHVHTDFLYA